MSAPTGRSSGVARAAALLAGAERVLVLTGAGMSAESGVPTFRGAGGLWKSFRAEDLATPAAFARDPRLVWEWYGWRRSVVAECEPNAAHIALAGWCASRPGFAIVTQNVDDLHERGADAAGVHEDDADEPLHLHGSIFRARCTACGIEDEHRDEVDASSLASLPRCGSCGGLLRPAVVWFGESLDPDTLEEAMSLAAEADACLVIGTSGVVQPAASLAGVTRDAGGVVIELNPEVTPLSSIADVALRGSAAEILPALLRAAEGGR